MNEKTSSVEEKIIFATIDCIEKYGISGATNRQIVQAAGVNLAAINYYFHSKDNLIQECMKITLRNAFDLSDIPSMQGSSAQERCIVILMHLFQGGFLYQNLTRAHFHNLLVEGRPDLLLEEHINLFIDRLAKDLIERGCTLEMDDLKLSLIQIVSAVFFAILAPTLFEQRHEISLHNPDTCLAYVTRLVKKLLE